MAPLTVTLACGDYDRTRALWDGRMAIEGVNLIYLRLEPEEIFWRMLRHEEFDVAEMSLAMYAASHSRGSSRFIAIPVFPSRCFRHSAIFVNAAAGIEHPADLAGRRVGVVEYPITAAVWVRGILQREYGVSPEQIVWVTGGQERPDRVAKTVMRPIPGVSIERAPAGRTLNEMLRDGTIDALVAARPPSSFLAGDARVRRLFGDVRAVESDYFRRTGIFPIMHTVVIKNALHEAHPWLAQSLLKAFVEAKNLCLRTLSNVAALTYTLPWMLADVEEMFALMGDDPWPYGVDLNRRTLEALAADLFAQGLAEQPIDIEALFAPSTFGTYKV